MSKKKISPAPTAPAAQSPRVWPQTTVPATSLQMAGYNPRTIKPAQLQALKKSLVEFGFVQPIVARAEDKLVIGGHQRLTALFALLKDQGRKPSDSDVVPVVFVEGVSDDKAKALNLALNKISGDWNYDALASLVQTLSTDARELSGFGRDELQQLMDLTSKPDAPPPDDLDVDDALQGLKRRLVCAFPNDEDYKAVRSALRIYGMTDEKVDAGPALARLVKSLELPSVSPTKEVDHAAASS
jgi:hypothetical protein